MTAQILVVEDEPAIQVLIAANLTRAGHEVVMVADAEAAHIHGPATTPWLLARVAEITGGRSIAANISLIVNNARVGGLLAVELARR